MISVFRTGSTVVWAILVAATAISWWLGTHHGVGSGLNSTGPAVAIIVIAFIKVRLVGAYFMGLRPAPIRLRLIFDAWVLAVCTALVAFYIV